MQVTIDRFGRMVLPKVIRDDLGLSAGDVLEATEEKNAIVLRPVDRTDAVKREGKILVFCGKAEGDIEHAVLRHREDRLASLSKGVSSK